MKFQSLIAAALPRPARAASQVIALAITLLAAPVWALEAGSLDGVPVNVDITESSSLVANTDNRNERRSDVNAQADDDWTLWYNRLNVQANWKGFQAGLRLDSAWFLQSRSPTDISLSLLELENGGQLPQTFDEDDADFFVDKFFQAGDELQDRFVNWVYPAKYNLRYKNQHFEATVGDFYSQLGRGLVLSVRKQDELSSDSTIRGARLTGRLRLPGARFKATALAGTMNPLRIDEASGRYLAVNSEVTPGLVAVTEAGNPHAESSAFDPDPRPNYIPDRVLAAQLESRFFGLGLGLQGSSLTRGCISQGGDCASLATDIVRSAGRINTGGVFVDLPRLTDELSLYVEYAHQNLSDFRGVSRGGVSGDAVYASLNYIRRPFAVTFEGKHYRRFFPLLANIDVGRAREFTPVQYSAPPTTEAIWNDTEFEGFNTCVTGGRSKFDWEAGDNESLFAWVGYYNTWAETGAAGSCEVNDDNLNRVWDVAAGTEMSAHQHKSRAGATVGARFDNTDRIIADERGGETTVFYREVYTRYDIIRWIGGGNSLQFQGFHRYRRQVLGGPDEPWLQGTTITSLQLGADLNFAFGFEYDENPAFPDLYFNGQVRYNLDSASNLSLFVGQRQGGLRCVSGVCRVFPPFEGARLDATFRL